MASYKDASVAAQNDCFGDAFGLASAATSAVCCGGRNRKIKKAAIKNYFLFFVFITRCGSKQYGFHLVHHPEKKHMPLSGFEPGSPRPQSKSDDLDCSAMGLAIIICFCLF